MPSCRSSGALTANKQVFTGKCKLISIHACEVGGSAASIKVYDNTSAAGIVKLPASAAIGDTVVIKDYAGNFGTNNLTIQRNSHKIQGSAADLTVSVRIC